VTDRLEDIKKNREFLHLAEWHRATLEYLDWATAEVERLKTEPQTCNSGHKRWPITLWDCPDCVVTRLAEKDVTIERLRGELKDVHRLYEVKAEDKAK